MSSNPRRNAPKKAAPDAVSPVPARTAPDSPPAGASGEADEVSAAAAVTAPPARYCAVPNCGQAPDPNRGHGLCAGHFASMRGYATKEEG